MIDIMIILPTTGNTMSKLANGIADTPATIAAKSHLRNELPLVIAIAASNGLGTNAESLGRLINSQNYFFVPFKQDNPLTKPRSIIYDNYLVIKTLEMALDREQIQPLIM